MNRLLDIVTEAETGAGVQFRANEYGQRGIRQFLVDVIAMANAPVDGNRYIVTGVAVDGDGQRQFQSVDPQDFSGKPAYESLVAEYVDPPLRLKYRPVRVKDRHVGVYEIGECRDKPYMMRIDYSERLRRGDAYVRAGDAAIKAGRRMLLQLFESRSPCAVAKDTIEVGFSGDVIQKKRRVPTVDLRQLPSRVERGKLGELIAARRKTRGSGSTTTMARLVHTQLFGADTPFDEQTLTGLAERLDYVDTKFHAEDQWFLFETHAQRLQLAVFIQGRVPLENASLTLRMPRHKALHVANGLPPDPGNPPLADDGDAGLVDYPAVSARGKEIYVASVLGDVAAGVPIEVFELPLRICAGSQLASKRLSLRYRLFGSNLRQPVDGSLQLHFQAASAK